MFKRLCSKHEHSPLITYLKINNFKVELLCNECIVQIDDDKGSVSFQNLILIEKAFKDCDYLLSKLNPKDDILSQFKQFSINLKLQLDDKINKIQNQMVEINKIFEIMITDLREKVKTFKILNEKVRQQLEQVLEYENFQQIIKDLDEIQPTNDLDANQQVEHKLQTYFTTKLKDNSKDLNEKLIALVNQNQQKLKEIGSFDQYCNFESSLSTTKLNLQTTLKQIGIKNNILGSELISNSFYKTLFKQLQEKTKRKIGSFQLIYLGTRDNLYAKCFWAKSQGKRGNVFGAFSPCAWNQELKSFVQDSTNSSFLFSQTFNEIYRIVNNKYAIYCNSDRGPSFGGGHDLYLSSNFEGNSVMHSYKLSQQLQENKTFLFGDGQQKLVECEVYQVQFQ